MNSSSLRPFGLPLKLAKQVVKRYRIYLNGVVPLSDAEAWGRALASTRFDAAVIRAAHRTA